MDAETVKRGKSTGCTRPSANTEVAKDFRNVYLQSCALEGVHRNRMVTLFLEDDILDIHAEKLDNTDWRLVIEALKTSPRHNLRFIAIRSSEKNHQLKNRQQKRNLVPSRLVIGSILCHLATALGCTLATTHHLTCLELQNLPLTLQDLTALNNGLASNNTLQHLSLQQCPIGDAGVEVICKVVKNCFNVTSLNLSRCQLSWKSADSLAILVKAVYRHCDTWKETLRDEIAILDRMGGVQRITLNGNAEFGDRGAQILAEVLRDDLWLKALDIQECGVQDQGAAALLSALKHNATLFILDLRLNFVKDCNLRLRISQQLSFNVQGQTSQFKWFKLPVDAADRSNTKHGMYRPSFRKRGIPWRVAARLSSIRHFPAGHVPGIANVFLHSKPTLLSGLSSDDRTEAGSARNGSSNTAARRFPLRIFNQRRRSSLLNAGRSREILDVIRTEITEVRELLRKEKESRLEADKQVAKLTAENEVLRQQLAGCDETTLATIEATFGKFNDFLKTLHKVGYGHLYEGYTTASTNVPFGDVQVRSLQETSGINQLTSLKVKCNSRSEVSQSAKMPTNSVEILSRLQADDLQLSPKNNRRSNRGHRFRVTTGTHSKNDGSRNNLGGRLAPSVSGLSTSPQADSSADVALSRSSIC